MLTGVYTHKHRQLRNTGSNRVVADLPIVFDYLIENGYKTGYFGKNHSGIENLGDYGIDGFYPAGYGDPYLTGEYRDYLERKGLKRPVYREEWSLAGEGNRVCDLSEAGYINKLSSGYLEGDGENHEAAFIFDMALDYIKKNRERPFCVRVDTWGPHHTFTPPETYDALINEEEIEKYPSFDDYCRDIPPISLNFIEFVRKNNAKSEWRDFRRMVKRAYEHYSFIDAVMGRFIEDLKDLGLYGDTAIILTADHGDALASHGGLADKSGDMQEELMSVPLVIKPISDFRGMKSGELVSNLDIPATLLDICGINIPGHFDGKSLLPLIEGRGGWERGGLMCQHYGHRKVDLKQRCYYEGDLKYIIDENGFAQLYNLKDDPDELINVAAA